MDDYWAAILSKAKEKRGRPLRAKHNRRRGVKKSLAKQKQKGEFKGTYTAYMKSNQWARKRQRARRYYRNRCTVCGSQLNLEVHHRHYRTLFREAMTDLDLLCRGCHHNHHEQDGKAIDPMTREFLSLDL